MNVHKAYQLAFTDGENPKRSQYKIENGICWINIKKIEKQKSKQTTCYNMSVENDESYTVNNVIVHNCTTFSVAAIGYHRRNFPIKREPSSSLEWPSVRKVARQCKDPATGSLAPKTEQAARADEVNRHTLRIIRSLRPRFFFIENPMGGLRKMDYMQGIPRHLITYCQYGFTYRKATDIWTNHPQPEFLPPCRNGDPCHQPAPRGTRQGLQGIQDRALRSAYPPKLCEHIVSICERYFDREPLPVRWHIDAKPPVQLELF